MKPKVEAWFHRVKVRSKTAKRHPYSSLRMLLKLKWQYLERNVSRVGTLMGPIMEALRETFFPALLGVGVGGDTDFLKILGHNVKHDGLGIPDPWSSEESA